MRLPGTSMRPHQKFSSAALALLAMSLSACAPKASGGPQGPQLPEVGVMTAQSAPVALSSELTGRTSAVLVSEVRPQVTGVVKARLFQEGANVRAGQPLYQIEASTYDASYASAKAALTQAEANATAAKAKADRYKDLVAINAISRQDNDDAQAAYQSAAANVAAQRASVRQAQINLGYTRVFSPISGRIGKSSVTPGALVTANQAEPLTTVQDTSKIYVDVTQSAGEFMTMKRDLAAGKLKQPASTDVTLLMDDGSPYPLKGKLAFSDITVDEGTGSVTLRAVFPNPDGVLLPGMYVRAKISKGVINDGILIPQLAISRDVKGDAMVFVLGAGDKAEMRMLTLGQTVDDKWLVTGGLKAGDKVIVDGLQKVRPGAPVKPVLINAGQ